MQSIVMGTHCILVSMLVKLCATTLCPMYNYHSGEIPAFTQSFFMWTVFLKKSHKSTQCER